VPFNAGWFALPFPPQAERNRATTNKEIQNLFFISQNSCLFSLDMTFIGLDLFPKQHRKTCASKNGWISPERAPIRR
jgi:hypothetical protein